MQRIDFFPGLQAEDSSPAMPCGLRLQAPEDA